MFNGIQSKNMSSNIKSKRAVFIEWQIFRLNLLDEYMISYFLAIQWFLYVLEKGKATIMAQIPFAVVPTSTKVM